MILYYSVNIVRTEIITGTSGRAGIPSFLDFDLHKSGMNAILI
jgi:hypothetical protein